MDLRELRAFVIVAEELNFRKAAEILNITQPPLTRLISQLESDLGVKLFTRSTRKVELTGAGIHLLQESRQLIESMNRVERDVRSIGKMKTGNLKIALNSPALHSELPVVISSFKGQFKGIVIDIAAMDFNHQLNALKSGKMDICFSDKKIQDQDIENLEILKIELGFLISSSHELAKKKTIELSDLNGETLIFHGKSENLGFQEDFYSMLKKKNIKAKVYYKNPKESCPHLAMTEKGLLLSSKAMAKNRTHGLKFVSLTDYSPSLRIYMNWSRGNPALSLKAFLSFFNEHKFTPSTDLDYHLGN